MPTPDADIVYTWTDEAPMLATSCLLPILQKFAATAGIRVGLRDISLAGRILARFPEVLTPEQRVGDALAELGALAETPQANIIKLPNISASLPQLNAAIAELQSQGYAVPSYPGNEDTPEAKDLRARYAKVLGSAVNPVLREGNSDRRVAAPVKDYARKNPHSMGTWSPDSKAEVAHMSRGDFYGSEQSCVLPQATRVRVELHTDQSVQVLRDFFAVDAGEVLDAAVMSCRELRDFYAWEIEDARARGQLLSLHLKATMMKVSDPILFGHAVRVFFQDLFDAHGTALASAGVNPNNGMADLLTRIQNLPGETRREIEAAIQTIYVKRPALAMVDSARGITNLHVPSDVIIDASMPAAIRAGGKMWGPDGREHDTKALIPDRCYAGVYREVIEFCKSNGAFDVTRMGSVANVGLMAKKAEEYGSHDKTFEIPTPGEVRVVDEQGGVLMKHRVEVGDIWRACQTKDIAIRDWVKLAVTRARVSGTPAVFWLDAARAHDANLIRKVHVALLEHDTAGLEISILPPVEATRFTCQRAKEGLDTISVTGNVLRDYLTDLFPILELGTSAKMLSIVPLLAGGGLFETGAGGSAPKHVQQFLAEGYLRWDSLGEYLAIAVSIEDLARKTSNRKAALLANALDQATGRILDENKSPERKLGGIDNRGTHFYLTLYWAQALAQQQGDAELRERFTPLAAALTEHENRIQEELLAAQGKPVDIGGYYHPDCAKTTAAMSPSVTFNTLLATAL